MKAPAWLEKVMEEAAEEVASWPEAVRGTRAADLVGAKRASESRCDGADSTSGRERYE
jgi:hypothetical protein